MTIVTQPAGADVRRAVVAQWFPLRWRPSAARDFSIPQQTEPIA
jgi:hypothetical protein